MAYNDYVGNEYSLSFKSSKETERGDLGHNLRLRNEGTLAQRGDPERHSWNVYWINPEAGTRENNPDRLVVSYLEKKLAKELQEYNKKYLAKRKYDKVTTIEKWYANQCVSRNQSAKNKTKRGYEEFILGFGYKLNAAPYVYKTNDKGEPVDAKGKVIQGYDTRKKLVPVLDSNGHKIKSKRYDYLVQTLVKGIDLLARETPEIRIISWSIHADEDGHLHAHIDYIGWTATSGRNKGLGVSLAKTAAMKAACDRLGLAYGNTKTDNPTKAFTTYWRERFKGFMKDNGMRWVDAKAAGRQYQPVDEFKASQDYRAEQIAKELEAREKAVAKAEADNERRRKANEAQAKVNRARAQALEKQAADKAQEYAEREATLVAKEKATDARLEEATRAQATAKQNLQVATDYLNSNKSKQKELEHWQGQLEAWSDDLMRHSNKTNKAVSKANQREREADNMAAQYERNNKEATLSAINNKAEAERLDGWRRQLEQKEQQLALNQWIIDRVAAEHPEWLKSKTKEFALHVERMKGDMTRVR